ncbi:LysR substrate-binding domain-containing protein, partial [Pseudomonas aeruginosa]|uniref:LysR substrate-binding domain-containing protein n=1 Tax=Pseudomonas aeruginosa TaxID=287 RepID=UPI003CC67682
LELSVEDGLVDFVADGYDAGIRYGGTVRLDMVAVPLTGELRWVVAASPVYLAGDGVAQRPDDLLRLGWFGMRLGDNWF